MNETIATIHGRRSVRFFADRPVDRAAIETIIDCGRMAPCGFNSQQWRFVVVQGEDMKARLRGLAIPAYQEWLANASDEVKQRRANVDSQVTDPVYYDAPAVVFVIGKGMTADYDCSMACQNMMLAARSLGIGSIWVYFGMLPTQTPEIQAAFDIQPDEKVYGPILLGYPKDGQFPECPPKNDPVVNWL